MEEELQALRLKEKILEIELRSVRDRINVYTAVMLTGNSVQEAEKLKTESIPVQTASGKEKSIPLIPVALGKSKLVDLTKTSPVANGSGKGISNPLIPVALEKSKMTEMSTSPDANGTGKGNSNPLSPVALGKSKMTILSKPNLSLQENEELLPDYLRAAKKDDSHYVIYEGPRKGIYTDWGVTNTICKEDKVTCKKFGSKASAIIGLKTFEDSKWTFVQPKIKKNRLNTRTSINFEEKVEKIEEKKVEEISFEIFRKLWSKARAADQGDFLHEKFFTDDKKTRSLFNFVEGADPELVYLAFLGGLVKNIYPSNNLLELKNFPSEIIESIKKYRKKVLQAKDSQIYIQVTSSIPDWTQKVEFSPHYLIEIGLANQKRELTPSEAMEDLIPSPEKLQEYRLNCLKTIAIKLSKFDEEDKIKVNFASSNCIITSWFTTTISKSDLKILSNFRERFFNNLQASTTTRRDFCRVAKSLFEDHHCNFCNMENSSAGSSQDNNSEKDNRQELVASREKMPTVHPLQVDYSLDTGDEAAFPPLYKEEKGREEGIPTAIPTSTHTPFSQPSSSILP